jgi:hypothetical protein
VEDQSTESSASAAERHARELFLQAFPLGGIRRYRSFSASLDWRPASIKSTSTRLTLVFPVRARLPTRLAMPVGIEPLPRERGRRRRVGCFLASRFTLLVDVFQTSLSRLPCELFGVADGARVRQSTGPR